MSRAKSTSMCDLLRYKNPAVEIHKAHAGIAGVRLATPSLDGLKHFPSGLGCNGECSLGCHQTDPQIRMIEKGQQRSSLIARSPFQFLLNGVHLPIKTLIFCIVVVEDCLIFLNAKRCEALDQLSDGKLVQIDVFHGLSTPNLVPPNFFHSDSPSATDLRTPHSVFHTNR